MYLIGLRLAELRGTLPRRAPRRAGRRAEAAALEDRGRRWPAARSRSREVAAAYHEQQFFLYLGRHIGLPVCLEGALKLKEISYIPTDAYAAGEMKHGPIALLDESTPVVCVATESPVLDKVLSNVEEVRARGAETIAIATAGCERVAEVADQTIEVARTRLDPAADRRDPAAAAARLRHRPRAAASTSTSRAIWPRPSRSSNGDRSASLGCARMIKTRLLLPVLAAAAALALLAGCGDSGGSSSTDPASSRRRDTPVFVEGNVQPDRRAEDEHRSARQQDRRHRRPRRHDRLRARTARRAKTANRSTSTQEIEPWLGESAGDLPRATSTARTSRAAASRSSRPTPAKRRTSSTSRSKTATSPTEDDPTRASTTSSTPTTKTRSGRRRLHRLRRGQGGLRGRGRRLRGRLARRPEHLHRGTPSAPEGSLADVYVDVGGLIEAAESTRSTRRR